MSIKYWNEKDKSITVVIPTYNRAHLLPYTLPTYIQPGVAELVVIDDYSNDNTPEVLTKLIQQYPIIRYKRLSSNCGQAVAKNVGILLATSPLIYFGDDDSLLIKNSIPILIECLEQENADIVGARAVYMLPGETLEDALIRTRRHRPQVVDIQRFRSYFDDDPGGPVVVPFVPACCLVKTKLAREIQFDPFFSGSGYREETDFFLRCSEAGARIVFCPQAISVNLPRKIAQGGSWAQNWVKYELSAIRNNWELLNRHYSYLHNRWGLSTPRYFLQLIFIIDRILYRFRWIIKSLLGSNIVNWLRRQRLNKWKDVFKVRDRQ